jgi:hypothetical protein
MADHRLIPESAIENPGRVQTWPPPAWRDTGSAIRAGHGPGSRPSGTCSWPPPAQPGRTAQGIPDELRLLLTDSVRERMTRGAVRADTPRRADRPRDTGVVDQYVNRAEPALELLYGRAENIAVRHVRDRRGHRPASPLDLPDDCRQLAA